MKKDEGSDVIRLPSWLHKWGAALIATLVFVGTATAAIVSMRADISANTSAIARIEQTSERLADVVDDLRAIVIRLEALKDR